MRNIDRQVFWLLAQKYLHSQLKTKESVFPVSVLDLAFLCKFSINLEDSHNKLDLHMYNPKQWDHFSTHNHQHHIKSHHTSSHTKKNRQIPSYIKDLINCTLGFSNTIKD